jgi:transcription elongation GreA/GreB family factor
MNSLLEVKKRLHLECASIVDKKIDRARNGMKAAQEAANKEGKSSMGDKYETSRAMMHLEKDKLAMQLVEVAKMKKAVDMMVLNKEYKKIEFGSLILTENANYFLSVSIGLITLDGVNYYAISPATPVGKLILGLKKGDNFTFNGNTVTIKNCI